MRVGIGALATSERAGVRQSGVHRYSMQLIAALADSLPPDELVVYTRPPFLGHDAAGVVHRRPAIALENPAVRALWEQTFLPARIRVNRIDLYHGLAFVLPRLVGVSAVVTIHDLAFIRWPEQTPGRRSRYLTRQVRDAVGRAARVIAVSEHTKSEIVSLLGVDPERIDVTPLGVDQAFRPVAESEHADFRKANRLYRPYILAVGNLEPRKNLDSLVVAFDRIAGENPHDLVLAGADGWKSAALHDAIGMSPNRSRIRLTGFISPDQLPLWYSCCSAFVIPSFDEGFGLTLLEAMACGAPAIAAGRGALPEVAGDAAQMSEPDPESLAVAMEAVLSDQTLQERIRLAGPQRAARFTWAQTAALTIESYRKAMA